MSTIYNIFVEYMNDWWVHHRFWLGFIIGWMLCDITVLVIIIMKRWI